MTCAVIGAGAWGTTLAHIASHNNEVILYTRDTLRCSQMQQDRVNKKYLPELTLSNNITITSNTSDIDGVDFVIFAVPSIGFRETIQQFSHLDSSVGYVSVTKGLEQSTHLRMSQVILDVDPKRKDIAVLSGPNLAHEIARQLPSATVVASESEELRLGIQNIFMTKFFRVYTSSDVIGCEIGGVAKNIAAIAAGIGDGFGYGDNAKATVMTRALAEITRLGIAEGGLASTFSGLAGVGDLIATCVSELSRNRNVGYLLGQGKTLDEIKSATNEIAEGVFSAQALSKRAQILDVEMPIVAGVAKVIQQGHVTSQDVEHLMTRPASKE